MSQYECNNDFIVRVPFHSLDFYEKNLVNDNCDLVSLTKKSFMENLMTSSYELYSNLMNNSGDNDKINLTLLKYLIRSSTRTTPYGMTSGVIPCSFQDGNERTMILKEKMKQNLRIDLEWLVPVVKMLESELRDDLILKTNNTFIKNGERVYNMWLSCFQSDDNFNNDTISIKNTAVVDYILNISKNGIKKGEILKLLKENCPEISENVFVKFVDNLIYNEFLISNFRFHLVNIDCFDYVLNVLEEYNYQSNLVLQLKEIKKLIDIYNIKSDRILYEKIRNKMKEIFSCGNYLRIDTFTNDTTYIPLKYKEIVEDFAGFLSSFSIKDNFNSYIMKFIDEYGNQAVKLLDLVERNDELAMPSLDQSNRQYLEKKLERFIFESLQTSTSGIVNLEELELIKSTNDDYENDYETMELSFYPINDDMYNLMCSPMIGSNNIGQSIGRFRYLYNDKFNNQNIPSNQVEVTYFPKKARYANVMNCGSDRDKILNYGGYFDNYLDIENIYVFVENQELKFINKKTGEIIEFYINNKINNMLNPKVINYLLAVNDRNSQAIFQLFYCINSICDKLAVSPRFVYKNIIVFPKSWRILDIDTNENYKKLSKDEFLIKLTKQISMYDIPTRVLVGEMDQRILLDLNTHKHLNLLYELWKKNRNIRLYESFFENDKLLMTNQINEKYVCEIVFEIEKKASHITETIRNDLSYVDQEMIIENSYLPFENWISYNLYISEINQDNFITSFIQNEIQELVNIGAINKYFFIRYRDPYPHIRLRLDVSNNDKIAILMNNITNKLRKQYQSRIISNVTIESYKQEFTRYGGKNLINDAEKVFYYDSIVSQQIIQMIKNKTIDLGKNEIFIISVLKLMKDMSISFENQENYLNRYKLKKDDRKKCRELKKLIDSHFDVRNELFGAQKDVKCMNMYLILEQRRKALKDYWNQVESKYDFNNQKKESILLSIIHMHHNRLIGINRERENFLMACLENYLHTLNCKEKYYNEK